MLELGACDTEIAVTWSICSTAIESVLIYNTGVSFISRLLLLYLLHKFIIDEIKTGLCDLHLLEWPPFEWRVWNKTSYIIKLKAGLDRDVCRLSFGDYGNVVTRQTAIDRPNNSATLPVYTCIATTQKTEYEMPFECWCGGQAYPYLWVPRCTNVLGMPL